MRDHRECSSKHISRPRPLVHKKQTVRPVSPTPIPSVVRKQKGQVTALINIEGQKNLFPDSKQ